MEEPDGDAFLHTLIFQKLAGFAAKQR